jgi:hypothetical protein
MNLVALLLTAAPLVAGVAASPKHVDRARAGLTRALDGQRFTDVSELTSALLRPEGDRQHFTAPPPASLPPALHTEWAHVEGACRLLFPAEELTADSQACARLGGRLLLEHLPREEGARLLLVETSVQKGVVEVTGHLWSADGATEEYLEQVRGGGDLTELVAAVTKALLKGDGSKRERRKPEPLGGTWAQPEDPFLGERPAVRAIGFASTCAKLPEALRFKTRGIVADSLSLQWSRSVDGTEPARSCALSFFNQGERDPSRREHTVLTLLTCGPEAQVSTTAVAGAMRGCPLDALTEELLRALQEKLCAGQPPLPVDP